MDDSAIPYLQFTNCSLSLTPMYSSSQISFIKGCTCGIICTTIIYMLSFFLPPLSLVPRVPSTDIIDTSPRIPSKRDEILVLTPNAAHLERAFICLIYDGALTYRVNQQENFKLLSVPNELELLALEEFKLAQRGYNEYKKLLFLKYGESQFIKQLIDKNGTYPESLSDIEK